VKKVLVLLTVVAVMAVGCGKAKKAVTAAPEKKATVVTTAAAVEVKTVTPVAVEVKTVTASAVTTTPSAL
jgi:uncharacterized protein YcfL